MEELPLPRTGRRDSVWLVLVEFLIIAALFVADYRHHVIFSKTPFLFLLGWISLRWRGLGWRDVGLGRPANWRRTIIIGVVWAAEAMQPRQGALDNPAEDAEAAAMRTAGLGGPRTLSAPWTPRTRPPRLGNRCAISTSACRPLFW